jgi:hypothetical protein
MTKKSDVKAKVKGADQEQKIVKKVNDGNKAALAKKLEKKKSSGQAGDAADLGKRTFKNKDKPKASGDGSKG